MNRGQRTEDSGQWTEDSGQWTEDSGQLIVDRGQFVFNVCILRGEHGMPPQRRQGQVPKNPLPPFRPQ